MKVGRQRRGQGASRGARRGPWWAWTVPAAVLLAGAALLAVFFLPRIGTRAAVPVSADGPPAVQAPAEPVSAPQSDVSSALPSGPAPAAGSPPAPAAGAAPAPRRMPAPPTASQDPPPGPAAVTVVIDSPAAGSPFFSRVALRGRILVPSGSLSEVDSARWSIDGTDRSGALRWTGEGAFQAELPADGLSRDLTITVSARLRTGDTGRASVTLRDRGRGPGVFIQSPRQQAVYGSTVRVWGQVRGPVEAATPLSEVQSLSWSLEGTALGGPLPWGRDGVFDFSFSTVGQRGPLTVSVAAVDRNGHRAVAALALSDRTGGPALRVEAPAEKSEYGASVAVSGRVGDPSDPSGTPAEVKKLSWRIVGQPSLGGTVSRTPDGRFSFSFSTAHLEGPQTLELVAEDRNGRSTTTAIALAAAVARRPAPPGTTAAVIAPQAPAQQPAKPPVQPPASAGPGPTITFTAPADRGFYKDITIVEGRVGAPQGASVKSVAWQAEGTSKSGKVALDSAGAFKLPLDLSDFTGDLSLVLLGEDTKGGTSRAALTLHDGRLKPAIHLASPAAGSSYGSMLRVSGTVADPYAGRAGMEGIESATYLFAPVSLGRGSAPARGTITLGPGGSFRFTLPTAGLSGDQNLTLTAVSRNGNRAEVTVRLSRGDGDLPGFRLVPSDRTVVVSWDPVPFVQRYDLVVTAEGASAEAPRTLTGVSSPATVSGLENGTRYALQVKAFFDDATTGESSVVRFIPLSPQTLAPMVTGEYQEIRLSWKGIPGASAYDVWRSHANGAASSYEKVAAGVSATSYRDAAVEFGRTYSYTISPAAILAPMSVPGSARSLAFPEEKLARIGHVSLQEARGITVNGGYAFVASGARGAQVIDVSNPAAPVQVGQIDGTDAWDLEVRGDYAYLADGDSGLRVLDISTPREPVELGQRKTNDARALAILGKYAYVADGDKGLKVIDISDARELPRVNQVDTVNALGVALESGYLYLADGPGGLKVFSLSRPAAPALVGSLATTDARQVAVQGSIAVVADGAAGLRVVDLADPAKPVLLSTLPTGAAASVAASVALEAGFAYVADGKNGVTVVNVEDPARPSAFVTQALAGASAVNVRGRIALMAGRDGLDVVRVQIIGRSFAVASCATGKSFDVTVDGDWAYVASHADGMRLVNVASPGDVTDGSLAGGIGTRFAQSVSVQGPLAFVADGANGVRIIDVSAAWTGGKPVELGTYRPGGTVSRAVPSGSLLYLAAGDRGVQVLDVSTPSAPAVVSSVRTSDASDVVVKGTWAFVADGAGGVRVLDVSSPASPALMPASVRVDASRLVLVGSVLAAAGDNGVGFIDVSDPRAPRLLARYGSGTAFSLAVRGSLVYVAEGYRGLTVLDVSRPGRPAVVTTCDEVFASGVAVKDDYAIVSDPRGIRVVQVLVPSWLQRGK